MPGSRGWLLLLVENTLRAAKRGLDPGRAAVGHARSVFRIHHAVFHRARARVARPGGIVKELRHGPEAVAGFIGFSQPFALARETIREPDPRSTVDASSSRI